MKKTLKYFAIAGLVALTITSCKKDDDDSNDNATNNTTTDANPTPAVDYPASETAFNSSISNDNSKTWGEADFELEGVGVQDCRHDDLMTLKSDGTYSYDNGALTCGTDEAMKTGTWEANYSEKTIVFDKGESDEYSATIVSLSEKTFKLEGKWSGMDITGTYTAQ